MPQVSACKVLRGKKEMRVEVGSSGVETGGGGEGGRGMGRWGERRGCTEQPIVIRKSVRENEVM